MFKLPPRSIKARDRRVIVRCPICKSATVRNSRNQVYCSARCRKSAFLHRRSDREVCVAVKPSNGVAGTDPFKNKTNSKSYKRGVFGHFWPCLRHRVRNHQRPQMERCGFGSWCSVLRGDPVPAVASWWGCAMTAQVIQFPSRGSFAVVRVIRDGEVWLVLTHRGYCWMHGSLDAALDDAADIAEGFGVAVKVAA
jgi:hypothetical protein